MFTFKKFKELFDRGYTVTNVRRFLDLHANAMKRLEEEMEERRAELEERKKAIAYLAELVDKAQQNAELDEFYRAGHATGRDQLSS